MKYDGHSFASSRSRGFTLIEVMITVVIVAILAALAYPSYIESIRKGRRAEARTALTNLMVQQERYMTQMGTYGAFAYGDPTAPGSAFKQYSGDNSGSSAYKLSAGTCGNASIRDCVKLTADPIAADTKAGKLTIDSLGNRDCTGDDKTVCWK